MIVKFTDNFLMIRGLITVLSALKMHNLTRIFPKIFGGAWAPQKIFGKISVKLCIFRALKTVITALIIGKLFTLLLEYPRIDACIDGASPYCRKSPESMGGGDRFLAPSPQLRLSAKMLPKNHREKSYRPKTKMTSVKLSKILISLC